MGKLFAFRVATVEPTRPAGGDVSAHYDPAGQQLVWQGDAEAILGAAVCTKVWNGHKTCSSNGGTYCKLGATCGTSGFPDSGSGLCYACDYG
jgi:hypothetical protein